MISGFGTRGSRRFVAALILAVACAGGLRAQAIVVHDTITAGGALREYYAALPSRVDPARAAALVFFFHGGGSNAMQAYRGYHFAEVAGADGAVVVYPEGINGHWNDDRGIFPGPDDYLFVQALVQRLSAQRYIDPHRIYATGHSNGAIFANSAACHLSGTFAAIGAMGGPLAQSAVAGCRGAHPLSVIAIHGMADPLVPYSGGVITGNRGAMLGADWTAAFWAAIDGCGPAPVRRTLAPVDASDPVRITKIEYRSCRDGRSVVLYALQNGGHRWPAGESNQPDSIVGPATRQMDATKVIWEFFAAHPSP